MADLGKLPFPPSELSWEKLPEVMLHMGLAKKEACTLLQLVMGAPSVSRKKMQSFFFHRPLILFLNLAAK